MITIFIAIAQSFVDSGFSQALIRKNDCTEQDYSTVFYFNIFVSIIFYIILFFSAGLISSFFNEKQLNNLIKALGLGIIKMVWDRAGRTAYKRDRYQNSDQNFHDSKYILGDSLNLSCLYRIWCLESGVALTIQ